MPLFPRLGATAFRGTAGGRVIQVRKDWMCSKCGGTIRKGETAVWWSVAHPNSYPSRQYAHHPGCPEAKDE